MKACCLETYNEGYNRGMEYKEQEIIKLLEKYEAGGSDPETYDHISHDQLLTLIKGENK